MISLIQAHKYLCDLNPLKPKSFTTEKALGKVCSKEICARANCPSVDSSLKDGFAVVSSDLDRASLKNPIPLTIIDSLVAGERKKTNPVTSGQAVRIMTGAAIPEGATAVLSSEFTHVQGDLLYALADAAPNRNILRKSSDIRKGAAIISEGEFITPTHLGLLAAGGVDEIPCYPVPKVAVAATGSELVWPGEPVTPGKVAASNMVTAAAELTSLGIFASPVLLRDDLEALEDHFRHLVSEVDVLITCGGVLDGDKDLTLKAMEAVGMEKIFHRVRIGPGKGVCMGQVGTTLVFNLPGGPPSNHVALLLIALPGIRRLMGYPHIFPARRRVTVCEDYSGQTDWTQLIYTRLRYKNGTLQALPLNNKGRLEGMAAAHALLEIPEGRKRLYKDKSADAWCFREV